MSSLSLRALACVTALSAGLLTATPVHAASTVPTRVSGFAVSPTTVAVGRSITVKGQAQKLAGKTWVAASGATATVSFDADGSAPNKAMRTFKADARGGFASSFAASASGYWTVTLKAAGTNRSSVSARVHVTVMPLVSKPPQPVTSVVMMAEGSISCPAYAPIKGNLSSHIFHLPGQRYYLRTHPEFCFATPADAIAKGFHAAKV